MRKIDEINSYLSVNSHKEKEELLKNIMKIFDISNRTAELYYYKWKKDFMNTKTCILENEEYEKVKIMRELKIKRLEIEGEFGNYVKEGNKVIAGEIIFNSLEEVEEYQKKEIELFNKRIHEIREVYKIGQ